MLMWDVYRWMPRTQTVNHYNKGDAYEFLIPCGTKKFTNEVINEFSFLSWFLNKTPFFALKVNTTHPHVHQAPDATGQKCKKSMFLYSGAGKCLHELKGKVLLVFEEMSNSKSGDWIAFANQLKDFIDSDTLMIEEKHNTSYPVTNVTNLIISSNNSKQFV
ncbi:4258_t:CDS:2 [Entrophospora sp. SA101]|nr:4258_t:CDS:2 [Entrophospora sp. SA101]